MRVLITGGHFSPAFALISELKKRGHIVAVAGRRHPFEGDPTESYEYEVTKKEKIDFFEIKTGRFQRKLSAYTFSSLLKTPVGFIRASIILRKFKPDVVVTFGGYIGLPISLAAGIQNIPVVLHEQTQKAGLAAKAISKIAKKICISFESSKIYFPSEKVVFTGNPIREEVIEVKKKIDIPQNSPVIYITGGSTGSHFINVVIEKIAEELLSKFVLIHQTGDSARANDFARLLEMREKLPEDKKKKYILKKFVEADELGFIYKNADLILSRAGANTICEIMAVGDVGLFIPLSFGQTGEQLENATLMKNLGIGDYIVESDATSDAVRAKIYDIYARRDECRKNMGKTKSYVNLDAAAKIADVVEGLNYVKA